MATNNHLELLVGIAADTTGSKESIQSQLDSLSKQLTGLEVQINVDKESKKVLDDLSKLDLSKLKTQVDDLNNSLGKIGQGLGDGLGKGAKKAGDEVANAARVAEKTWKDSMDEVSKAVGVDLDKVIKKGYTSVDEIKKAFSSIDGNVKLDFDVSEGAKKLQNFKAQIERDGITQTIDFKMVGIQDGNATVNAWMPNMVKEVDRSVQQASKSLSVFIGNINKLNRDGKITEDQFNQLSRVAKEMEKSLSSTNGLRNLDVELAKANRQVDSIVQANEKQVEQERLKTKELKEQERLRDRLHKLEVDMISMGKSRPKTVDLNEYKNINTEIEKMNKLVSSGSNLQAGEVKNLTQQYQMLNAQTKEVGRTQMGVVDSFKVAMEKFPIWMAASTAFYGAVRTANEFMSIIVDIDTKMVTLSKVLSDDVDLEGVFDRATISAERFGQTISSALDSFAEFARQGFSGNELAQLADAALVAANVGELGAQEASEYMTASLIQWNKESSEAMGIIDQWNAISNNYATTVEKLAAGQTRAGATMRAVGLDFEEANSLIATLTASTKQSGEEIGNFLKSAIPRLTSRPAQKAMESLGVTLTDGQGNLRNIIDVYTEIAQKVQNISDSERLAVYEGLAGKYHISRMTALLDDLGSVDSMYQNIENTARNSAGSAAEENAKYMESLEARMALTRVEIEKLALSIGDAFLTEGMVQFLKVSGDVLGSLTEMVTKYGALPGILGTVGAAIFLLSGRFRGLVGSITQAVTGLLGFNTATKATSATTKAAAGSTGALTTALRSLGAATIVGGVFVLLGIALEKVVGKMGEAREESERLTSEQKIMMENYKANAETIDALAQEYAQLEDKMSSGSVSTEDKERLVEVQNELASQYPSLISGEDEHGNSIMANSSIIESHTELLKQQLEIEKQINAERAREDSEARIEEATQKLGEYKEQIEGLSNTLDTAVRSVQNDFMGQINMSGMEPIESYVVDSVEAALEKKRELDQKIATAMQNGNEREADYYRQLQASLDTFMGQYNTAHMGMQNNLNILRQETLSTASAFIGANTQMSDSTRKMASDVLGSMVKSADSIKELEAIDNVFANMDFDTKLQSKFGNVQSAIEDFTNSTSTNLNANRREMREAFDELENYLISSGQVAEGSAEHEALTNAFNNQANSIVELVDKAQNLAETRGISIEQAMMELAATGELTDEYGEQTGKIYELTTAIDMLVGMNEQQIADADQLLQDYDMLSAQLANLTEGTLAYEYTQQLLDQTSNQLIETHGGVISAYDIANLSAHERVEMIRTEVEANDILRAAYSAMRDGKLTSEQESTVSSLANTNARIKNINAEIRALNFLAEAYRKMYADISAQAKKMEEAALQSGYLDENAYTQLRTARAQAGYGEQQALRNLGLQEAALASANAERTKMTNILRNIPEVINRGTTAANKGAAADRKAADAAKKGSKAKKDNAKASKEQQKAIEETNETIREAIYLADTYAEALDRLALAIKKEQDQRSKFSEHSKQYRESIMREIELQKEQLNVMQQQEQAYKNQISKGVVIKRGEIVTTEYEKTTSTAPSRTVKPAGFGGRITSQYGMRRHPISGVYKMHQGVDVAGYKGQRLDSPVDGKVVKAAYHSGWGNHVVVQDKSGMKHLMAHMNSIGVKIGQEIMAGMQIGTIGSTGSSTNPHLHYEVMNASGKNVNPTPYLNKARAGVKSGGGQVTVVNPVQKKSATEEIAQSEQDVANLKSELLGLQGEMVDIAALIRQLEIDMVNSQIAEYDAKRQQYQQTIDYEQEKIKGLDVTSERYLKTLDIYIREMNNKQRVNKQELDYLNRMINSGQLTAATTDELKVRVRDLTTEMMALNNEIQQVSFDKITTSMRKFEEALSEIEYQLSLSEGKLSAFEEGTGDYNKELANQISLMKQRSDEIMRQRYALERLILSENINIEQIKELKQQIQSLNLEYWSLQGSIKSTEEALADAQKKLANEVADRLIESYKQVIQERQEAHMRAIDKEMDAEDKRHQKVMDNYKKELDSFNKIIQAKLDEIDREESERDYNKEIDELEKDRRELTDQLNLLKLDDSFEAKAQRRDLQEQISQIDETIAEKRHDREVELRKEALNEMLEDKQEEISEQEKAETERHEAERDRIDKQREYWNQYYNDLANDERKFAQIREQILAGNFDNIEGMFKEMLQEMIDTMPELENTMDGTMAAVGTSIRQNIIDNLREALSLLSELGAKQSTGSNPQTQLLSTADMQVLAGKFITENLAEQFDDDLARQANVRQKGYDLAAKGRAAGSTVPKDVGYDAYLSRLTPEQQKQLKEFIGAQSGMYLTPKYNEALENYGKGQRFTAADYKVLTGKFMMDKAASQAKNTSERNVIVNRARTWGQQGRSQGSKLDQYASFDQLIGSMDNQELTEFANYLQSQNLFSEYYLKSFVEDYVKRILATATQFETGGYTGSWNKSGGKLAVLHEKELVLNQAQTQDILGAAQIMERIRNMMPSVPTMPQSALSGADGGNTYEINFHIDKMNGDVNDVRKFSKMFGDHLKQMKGMK